MVRVTLHTRQGVITGFELMGHANRGEYGYDLVCCAISAISQTAILGLTEVIKIKADFTIEDGVVRCTLPQDMDVSRLQHCQTVINTMAKGLEAVEREYPGTLKIKHREV